MKRILMLAAVVLLLALGAGTALAQSGYDLFQKALVKERAVGDVEEALRLYQRIVKEFSSNRALVAKAQLRLGLLNDRLGRKADAQRAYQVLVNQYADQTNEAQQARAKIVTVAAPPRNIKASTKTTSGLTVRQVRTGFDGSAGRRAAISPDGSHFVYAGPALALYVRDLQTGENRRLTPVGAQWDMEQVWSPVLSPDGKLVAYGRSDKGRYDLRLIALDGSAPRVLHRSDERAADLRPFDWTPDGKQILALTRGQSGTQQIVLLTVGDGSVHSLKALVGASPQMMSLSRDGRYLVYDYPARKDSPERDIFILGTDGGHEARLVTRADDDNYPVWTPDGRGVVFLSRRAANGPAYLTATSLWFLRVVDGKPQGSPELVKRDMGQIVPIGFTPNGSLYYSERSVINELYTATLDPTSGTIAGQPATVTQRSVTGNRGRWSPNGQYLAYTSLRPSIQGEAGAKIIVIRSDPAGEEYELAPALSTFDMFGWSPDSRFLLTRGTDKEKRDGLYRVDARTGDVAPLLYAKPGEVFSRAHWFPNEKSIVFIRRDSVGQRIVRRNLETGHETELYRPPAPFLLDQLEVSGDGQRLAFDLRDREAGTTWLMVMTGPGEKPRELGPRVKFPEVIDQLWALTPDGGHVLFTTANRERLTVPKCRVWRIAVDGGGGPLEIQLPLAEHAGVDVVSFHPDGRRIAFTVWDYKTEVWVMDNFLPSAQTKKATASRR